MYTIKELINEAVRARAQGNVFINSEISYDVVSDRFKVVAQTQISGREVKLENGVFRRSHKEFIAALKNSYPNTYLSDVFDDILPNKKAPIKGYHLIIIAEKISEQINKKIEVLKEYIRTEILLFNLEFENKFSIIDDWCDADVNLISNVAKEIHKCFAQIKELDESIGFDKIFCMCKEFLIGNVENRNKISEYLFTVISLYHRALGGIEDQNYFLPIKLNGGEIVLHQEFIEDIRTNVTTYEIGEKKITCDCVDSDKKLAYVIKEMQRKGLNLTSITAISALLNQISLAEVKKLMGTKTIEYPVIPDKNELNFRLNVEQGMVSCVLSQKLFQDEWSVLNKDGVDAFKEENLAEITICKFSIDLDALFRNDGNINAIKIDFIQHEQYSIF